MTNQHFAERFKSARIMKGFSLQDLANQIESKVSRQALHKYEKGEVIPDSEMMGYLCQALDVRPDYFYQSPMVELGKIEFRKFQRLSAKDNNSIIEKTRDFLSRYQEIEEILGIETVFQNPLEDCEIHSLQDVEEAAKKLREHWKLGIGALSNILELLEDKGIRILEIDENPDFSGMQTWVDKIPVIVVNKNKEVPLDRKRFTALHELAHLLLKGVCDMPHTQKETYCHYFAGAMLFHQENVKSEIGEKRNHLSINELGAIKMQYGISIKALTYRLRDLGCITESYHKQFVYLMNHHLGMRTQEPAKFDYKGIEKSNRFEQLIFRALAENLITISKAASLKNQKLAEFRDENFLI